jgi:predicted nucleic acid-binding Zn ribbon protein
VLQDLGFGESVRALRIAERWTEAVGEAIALHGRPTALRGEVLEVTVDSSPWCQQLQLRRPEILAALRETLGEEAPADVWFRVGT